MYLGFRVIFFGFFTAGFTIPFSSFFYGNSISIFKP